MGVESDLTQDLGDMGSNGVLGEHKLRDDLALGELLGHQDRHFLSWEVRAADRDEADLG
jgi:hypothetical protein